jgi:hypothetical protein
MGLWAAVDIRFRPKSDLELIEPQSDTIAMTDDDQTTIWPRALRGTVTILPVLTIAAISVAIAYNVVYLFFAGVLGIAPLTLTDVVSKAWVIIPFGFLFIAFQLAFIYAGYTTQSLMGKGAQPTDSRKDTIFDLIVLMSGMAMILISPVVVAIVRAFNVNSMVVIKALIFGQIVGFVGFIWIVMIRPPRRYPNLGAPIAAYILLMMLLSAAAQGGLNSVITEDLAVVRYGDGHVFCGRLVSVLERGVIVFEPVHQVKKLIPTSELKSIETPAYCKTASRAPASALPAGSKPGSRL